MYSIQHVLWRGVMAISLMAIGGLGASYSVPVGEPAYIACDEALVVAHVAAAPVVADATTYRHVQFDTIVVRGIPPMPSDA
jgi:hypothetical protein